MPSDDTCSDMGPQGRLNRPCPRATGNAATRLPGVCCLAYDVRGPVAGASPNLNFVLGFKRGINRCFKTTVSNPVTLCQIGGSVPAATLKNAVALAGIVATGRVFALGAVMQDLQNDINGSPDPIRPGPDMAAVSASGWGRRRLCADGGGGRERAGSSLSEPSCTASGPPPLVRGGSLRLANANQWLPQFTRTNCSGNCGYVVRAWTMRLAVAASFCPDESIHDNLPGFTRLHSDRRAVESKQKHWVSFL